MIYQKYLIIYLSSINIISLILCAYDKINAIKHKQRISEKNLLTVSAIGGSLGMIIAMNIFHHKTKKIKFKIIYVFFIIHVYLLIKIFEII